MKINRVCVCRVMKEGASVLANHIQCEGRQSTAHNYDQERFESKCSGDYLEVVS